MSDCSSENNTPNLKRRTFLKNKKQEIEETDNKTEEKITVSSNIKKTLSLFTVLLLLLVLVIIMLPLMLEIGNAGAKETSSLSMACSSRFESALQKLEDQMETLEQATKMVQVKLSFLDKKIHKIDLDHYTVVDIAKRVTEEELEKHEADGLGEKDHALASGGAFILSHSEPMLTKHEHNHYPYPVSDEAITMLSPSFGEPGRCFSVKGSSGFVEIRLRTAIVAKSVTLEHVSTRVAYNMSSSPKDCVVSAWFVPKKLSFHDQETTDVHKLVSFRYDVGKNKSRQTFEIEKVSNDSDDRIVNVVRFDFVSNYGADHTCIYRLRVHGDERNACLANTTQIRNSGTRVKLVSKFVLVLVVLLGFHI